VGIAQAHTHGRTSRTHGRVRYSQIRICIDHEKQNNFLYERIGRQADYPKGYKCSLSNEIKYRKSWFVLLTIWSGLVTKREQVRTKIEQIGVF